MPNLDTVTYDNLVCGDFPIVTEEITVAASQTIKRGDVLVKASGKFARASAAVASGDVVVVAAEDITSDAASTPVSVGYKSGQFNSNAMRFGGASTAADNSDPLAEKGIYLKTAKPQ